METARDPFDELASLYLGDASPATPPAARKANGVPLPQQSRVTIAVCGHLPVMAGLWVTQYADLQAAEAGPVGLVRLEGGRCSIELLRAEAPPRLDGLSMTEAARKLVTGVRRWIVCVDDRDAAVAVRSGAEEVVVLTSGDRIAVVEAFRLVKSAWARAVDPGSVDVGVVIVGADEATAARAGGTLEQMSQRHLDRPLSVMASVRRIDAVDDSCRIAFDESLRGDAGEIVASIREALDEQPAPEPPSDEVSPATPGLRLADCDHEPDFDDDDDFLDLDDDSTSAALEAIFGPLDDIEEAPLSVETPDPVAPRSSPGRSEREIDPHRQRPRVPSPVRVSPSPAIREGRPVFLDLERLESDAGERDVPAGEGVVDDGFEHRPMAKGEASVPSAEVEAKPGIDLLQAIGGLRRVDWPFATAPGVACGIDEDGGFHLICHAADHGQLDTAMVWARKYRRQIAGLASIPVEAIESASRHVVTGHAPSVADLHRTGVRLHLLVEVEGAPRAMPLNDESNRSMPD